MPDDSSLPSSELSNAAAPTQPVGAPHVASPFAHAEAVLPTAPRSASSSLRWLVWVFVALLLVAVGGVGGSWVMRSLNDPLRTMETFPAGKYFDNYQGLAGTHFKSELRVDADLGWRESMGRLMLFTTPTDSRPVAVLIPNSLGNIYFTKGQTYMAELEVKGDGLVYAHSCRKN